MGMPGSEPQIHCLNHYATLLLFWKSTVRPLIMKLDSRKKKKKIGSRTKWEESGETICDVERKMREQCSYSNSYTKVMLRQLRLVNLGKSNLNKMKNYEPIGEVIIFK